MEKHRYLLLMRPPTPGAIPIGGLLECREEEGISPSGHHTLGWAIYNRKLSDQEVFNFELEEDKTNE